MSDNKNDLWDYEEARTVVDSLVDQETQDLVNTLGLIGIRIVLFIVMCLMFAGMFGYE